MIDRKMFADIPGGRNTFHSAVLTSFSFNFHHFENEVLRFLKQRWISSINVLVDQNILDELLGLNSGNLNSLSQSYSVNGLASSGAFHPKINFFLGDNKILVLLGSGNITPGGHGKNHEVFSGFYADSTDSLQLPLVLETWNYIVSKTDQINGYSANRIQKVLPKACKLLSKFEGLKHQFHSINETVDVALLYNEDTSILDQLKVILAGQSIEKITIVAPYFDEDGRTLSVLKEIFRTPNLEVFLQTEFGLPPVSIPKSENIKFFDWDYTPRGKKKIAGKVFYPRKLHGKIFHFRTKTAEYCLIGSPNATSHAIGGLTRKPSNDEFAALYKSSEIDFLKHLGIRGKKVKVDVHSLKRTAAIPGDERKEKKSLKIRIASVDLEGLYLSIYLKNCLDSDKYRINFYDQLGEEVFSFSIKDSSSSTLRFKIEQAYLTKSPSYCLIIDEKKEVVSNKQLINHVSRLKNTNPSESNRAIRELISSIEGGFANEFEIIEYLNQIQFHKRKTLNVKKTHVASGSKNLEKKGSGDSGKSYQEAINSAEEKPDPLADINNNSASRLWESLQQLFNNNKDAQEQDRMDEEEDDVGDDKKPRDRKEPQKVRQRISSEKAFLRKLRSLEKMALSYLDSLEILKSKPDHKIDLIDHYQFLLVTTLITNVCYFTDYDLKVKDDSDLTEAHLKKHLDLFYRECMLLILIEFLKFCRQKELKCYNSDEPELKNKEAICIKEIKRRVFLYLSLIERKTKEEVVLDKIYLIGLNFLKTLGQLDSDFELFIQNYSKYYQDLYFSPQRVIRLKNDIGDLFEENDNFVLTKYNGYGKIIGQSKNQLKIKTLEKVVFLSENQLIKSVL